MSVADPLSRIARMLGPAITRVGARVGPLGRLSRIDLSLARAWLQHAGALEDTLGPACARSYTALVVQVATRDVPLARTLAHALPDSLARVKPARRARYLHLLTVVVHQRLEALPLVSRALPDLLDQLDDQSLSIYLARALEIHADAPQKAESFLRQESQEGMTVAADLRKGLSLVEVQRTLTLYARAHCGQDVLVLPAAPGQRGFTDGRHIHLPPQVDHFGDRRDFLVYRVLTARNAGYLEFGSLDLDLDHLPGAWPDAQPGELVVEQFLRGFPNRSLARDLFTVFEDARIEALVRAEYPGVARDMDQVAEAWRAPRPDVTAKAAAVQAVEVLARSSLGLEAPPDVSPTALSAGQAAADHVGALRGLDATVQDVAEAVVAAYPAFDALLKRVDDNKLDRVTEDDRPAGDLPAGPGSQDDDSAPPEPPRPSEGGSGADDDDPYESAHEDPLAGSLRLDAMSPEERQIESRARELLNALRTADAAADADLQEARERARRETFSYEEMADMLDRMDAPAGPVQGTDAAATPQGPPPSAPAAPLETDAEDTGVTALYPEWDALILDHKPDWVKVREYRLAPGSREFVDRVQEEHGALVAEIRRAFEALRPEGLRRQRGLTDGDEIDIDRAIQDRIAMRAGGSGDGRVYARRRPRDRDVGVAFLLDMSSSTNEVVDGGDRRVIDVEKEALVLTAEAVDAVGDTCAIWGFSGYGRDQVAFYVAKEPEDAWDDTVRERIGRMSWKMENRDGAAIRHATAKMSKWRQRVKLLILLSDGRPLDCGCDHYSDRYAQEDTRAALAEARAAGIHPFCITVDPQGQRYLERMYGEVGFTVIDRVELLPMRLTHIYRRLTR